MLRMESNFIKQQYLNTETYTIYNKNISITAIIQQLQTYLLYQYTSKIISIVSLLLDLAYVSLLIAM